MNPQKTDISLDEIISLCQEKYGELFSKNYNEEIVNEALRSFPISRVILVPSLKFYRIRKNIRENEDLTNPKTFSYPNWKYCRDNGRANLLGFPVFYCSDKIQVAVSEVRPELGDYLYISEWEPNDEHIPLMSFSATEESMQNSIFNYHSSSVDQLIKERVGPDIKISNDLRYGNANKMFLDEYHPYSNSSVYSFFLMYGKNVDIIIYPSLQWEQNYTNLAMKPEFVDECLRLNLIFKTKITGDNLTVLSMSLEKIGKFKGDKVKWETPNKYDKNEFSQKFAGIVGRFDDDNQRERFPSLLKDLDDKYIERLRSNQTPEDNRKSVELFEKGLELSIKGKYYDALKYFDKSIDLCGFMPMYYYHRGLCNQMINKLDDAIRDYSNAIWISEANAPKTQFASKAYCNRGTIYFERKNYQKGTDDLLKAIELNPRDHIAISNLGNLFLELKQFEKAIESYESALILKPGDERILSCKKIAIEQKNAFHFKQSQNGHRDD